MIDISVIIPVYNSQDIITKTLTKLIKHLTDMNINYQIILVNDSSHDNSWNVMEDIKDKNNNIIIVDLLKNYGQHSAILCGLSFARGEYIVTLDDDLQNPPSEISKLYSKIREGYDLVFAKFSEKKHPDYRRWGSKVVKVLNEKIFQKPKNIELTNFRIFTGAVAERVLNHKSFDPYIPGLLLLYSSKICNVTTEHSQRTHGTSNYTIKKILKLVARLLFNYSTYPLNVTILLGFIVSILSLLLGLFFILKHFIIGIQVPGWTTVVVLLSFFTSVIMLAFGVIGQYLIRLLKQSSNMEPYHIKSIKK